MNPYFLTIIILYALDLGIILSKHGESSGRYNIFISLPVSGIMLWLIYNAIHWVP